MKKLKRLPVVKSDKEAEEFVVGADLSEYDLTGFRAAEFEYGKKDRRVTMRIPEGLLRAVWARAERRRIPYQRFIREALERAVR
jgi:predicted DNA binding CopG/RHH family protein